MIQEIVDRYVEKKEEIAAALGEEHVPSYEALVRLIVTALDNDMDPERIIEVNHGDYQGTLLFVIGGKGYKPDRYWVVKVGYGSCSGCDTLEGIRRYEWDKPTESQVSEYSTLALHIVQGLKEV